MSKDIENFSKKNSEIKPKLNHKLTGEVYRQEPLVNDAVKQLNLPLDVTSIYMQSKINDLSVAQDKPNLKIDSLEHPFSIEAIKNTPIVVHDMLYLTNKAMKENGSGVQSDVLISSKIQLISESEAIKLALAQKNFNEYKTVGSLEHLKMDYSMSPIDKIAQLYQTINSLNVASGVEQGGYGDCWFEATVAALANTASGAQIIADMITVDKSGNYWVKFPGKIEPVSVTKAELEDPKLANASQWANIIEAAMHKAYPRQSENGSSPDFGMRLFANKNIFEFNIADDPSLILNVIKYSLADGNPITASSFSQTFNDNLANDVPIVDNHVYSIINLDEKNQTITIRNPWGENYNDLKSFQQIGINPKEITNLGNGELVVPLNVFMTRFKTIVAGSLKTEV